MLIKCMLPISLVENEAFREFVSYLDPSFNIPSRHTVKETGLKELCSRVTEQIRKILMTISFITISIDLWSDACLRGFNGFIAQGISDDWVLYTIPIAFEYVEGN